MRRKIPVTSHVGTVMARTPGLDTVTKVHPLVRTVVSTPRLGLSRELACGNRHRRHQPSRVAADQHLVRAIRATLPVMKTIAAWVMAIVALIGAGVVVEVVIGVARPPAVASPTHRGSSSGSSTTPNAPAPPCVAGAVDPAAGLASTLPAPRFACTQRWALVTRGTGAHSSFALLEVTGARWVRQAAGAASQLPFEPLGGGVSFRLL